MVKICLIGGRGHSGYVFDGLKQVPEIEITGIASGCDDFPQNLSDWSKQAGFAPKVYDCWREMLNAERPEIVSVDGPFERHAEMCIEALSRGIHVFCEKPIALNFADLKRIEDAQKRSGAKIISMVGLRYLSAFYDAKQLVDSGKIGKIKLISTRKSYKLGTRPDFYRSRKTYGGTIPWVGSHAIDWIIYFSGTDFESVTACQTTADNSGNGELEICAMLQFQMQSGIMAQASIDFLRPESAPTHGDDRIRIVGTKGVLEIIQNVLYIIDSEHAYKMEPKMQPHTLFGDFVAAIEGKLKDPVTVKETFALTYACLLARESA
ncbi:MAG: Gfo/Idh/MocA family oxidoreductase, partial [Lentisphaeria bacterium]